MTIEDAINYFKGSWAIGEDDASRHHNDVLEFTIKILEQEPCDDTISREAVKELFQEGSVMGMYYFLGIDKLPSVTPARKKGKWIITNDYLTTAYGSIDYVKCSCCGEESLEESDYCPNCGSYMKGEFE